jgi:hypothetical protein
MKFDHEYYLTQTDGTIDLAKIREECDKRRRGDAYKEPESSRIHFHKHDESCTASDHEEYTVSVGP